MWYFADFNILIRKIILNKFQFQPQSVLNLFLFFWAIWASVFLLSLFLFLKKSVFTRLANFKNDLELTLKKIEINANFWISFCILPILKGLRIRTCHVPRRFA